MCKRETTHSLNWVYYFTCGIHTDTADAFKGQPDHHPKIMNIKRFTFTYIGFHYKMIHHPLQLLGLNTK